MFYSGFYTPLYYLGNNKLNNVAEIIKLILRDESVHGTYIGYKYQIAYNQLSDAEKQKQDDWAYDLLYKLYANEEKYAALCYDQVGWTKEVMTFVEYNANKALMNLGKDSMFPTTASDVNPIIMNGINTTTSNHDFFSQVGNGYLLGQVEAMSMMITTSTSFLIQLRGTTNDQFILCLDFWQHPRVCEAAVCLR